MISQIIKRAWELTGIYNFDPADTDVLVCGKSLQDFTKISISRTPPTKQEAGIHPKYYTYVKTIVRPTIRIEVLPYSADHHFLKELNEYIIKNGGAFLVSIKTNGMWLGSFRCHFTSIPDDDVDKDVADAVFVLNGVEESAGVFS